MVERVELSRRHLSCSTVAPSTFLFRYRRFQTSSRWYLLKYGVPRHPPQRHQSIHLPLHTKCYMDSSFTTVYFLVSSSRETFVKIYRCFWRGYRGISRFNRTVVLLPALYPLPSFRERQRTTDSIGYIRTYRPRTSRSSGFHELATPSIHVPLPVQYLQTYHTCSWYLF